MLLFDFEALLYRCGLAQLAHTGGSCDLGLLLASAKSLGHSEVTSQNRICSLFKPLPNQKQQILLCNSESLGELSGMKPHTGAMLLSCMAGQSGWIQR